ncbi:hypothetical protein M4D70_19025 [Brevibacillus borstelensis]|uniref:hypothetical protein n=1 Tax=Brevibacillus borstelensis TaxID=45462 RepID=UPI0020410BEF|nr:hypothetical protein [Brevibacillus borstelensis]MCM3624323.1 hypothetical protein [Brevibacillus borstelensis]
MKWDQELFIQYVAELQEHLFSDMTLEEIIEKAKVDHHRARRFMNLYILKDKTTFHNFYSRREDLEIQSIFDQVISALFYETEKRPIKQEIIIDLLGIRQEMIQNGVEGYGIKEFDKDLLAYGMYWRKRRGDLAEMREEIRSKLDENNKLKLTEFE